jgi:two-component system, NtrC family, response regulator AtoC
MPLILLVDDDEEVRWSLKQFLKGEDYEFAEAGSGQEGCEFIQRKTADLVILDLRMPGMDGFQTLERLIQIESSIQVLILTGNDSVKGAVQAMKLGAADYLVKPVDPEEFRLVVRKTLENSRLKREVQDLRQHVNTQVRYILGKSPAMRNLDSLVKTLAVRDVNVLIQGESGTGKQVIAETMHYLSPRQNGPFVTLDCGALPDTLIESEIFGYEKGAFTGAVSRKMGKLELAKGGTLFLDEIGNLDIGLQSKLLRVLETRQFERVGGTASLLADFRLITATNADLKDLVERKEFRSDLYYRINVFMLEVPPLRDRPEDIPDLSDYFVQMFNQKHGKQVKGFSPECVRIFQEYSWPGNVRQLRNVIERAVLLSNEEIGIENLSSEILQGAVDIQPSGKESILLEALEAQALKQALKKNQGDKTRAAAELGISLRTLYYWLKKYQISGRT